MKGSFDYVFSSFLIAFAALIILVAASIYKESYLAKSCENRGGIWASPLTKCLRPEAFK